MKTVAAADGDASVSIDQPSDHIYLQRASCSRLPAFSWNEGLCRVDRVRYQRNF